MTEFSRRLGEFFARTASFPDLERAADDIVRENHDIDHALNILDRHRDSGRLPAVLHRALSDRLMGKAPPVDNDATKPLADNSVDDDAADLTERISPDPAPKKEPKSTERPALMQDQTEKLKSLLPDDMGMLEDPTSMLAEKTEMLTDAASARADKTELLADIASTQAEQTEMFAEATLPQADRTEMAADADLTQADLLADATSVRTEHTELLADAIPTDIEHAELFADATPNEHTETLADATSPQLDRTAERQDAAAAQIDNTELFSEATSPQKERKETPPDATTPHIRQTAVKQTSKNTKKKASDAAAQHRSAEPTAPLQPAQDARQLRDSSKTGAPDSPAAPKPNNVGQKTDDADKVTPAEAVFDKTLQVNSHVAPTVRIGGKTPTPQPPEKTRQISDVTRPDVQRSETQLIADVPAPNANADKPDDKTLLLSDVPPPSQPTLRIDQVQPPTDSTLPIGDVPKPDASSFESTQALDSGVFPSKAFPTGTASNWLRPDQWSERHVGPVGPGMVLKQRFMIERQLGRGGMGVVFKARDKRKEEASDRDPFVAVKVLNDNYRDHPQALIALQREARKAQTLAHPNIVTVYDFDRDGTTVYMTMELMRGEPLDVLLRRRKKENEEGVEVELARRIIKEMAAGLAYAHKHDIIHSDFKPGNVFLTEDERVKILDFGIARARAYSGPKEDTEQTMFDAGDFSSLTPGYAAWEMFQRADPHPADDVYAMAITAYLLLTGLHPFDRKTAEEVVELGLVPEPIKHIARHEWAAIEHGLALKREDRTQDAASFLREFSGRRKLTRWATAAIVVLSVLAGFFAYTSFQDPGPAIAWSELTTIQQATFREHISSGEEWLANDPPWIGGAYNDFAAAYEIHPRNPEATSGLDAVASSLIALAGSAESAADKRRLLGDIETVSSNEYLKEHRKLRALRRELSTQ